MEQLIHHEPKTAETPTVYSISPSNRDFPLDVKIVVGDMSFIDNCRIRFGYDTAATIYAGKFTSIAMDATMVLASNSHQTAWATQWPLHLMPWGHSLPPRPMLPAPDGKWDIHIGNDVWVGDGARILSGVTIGDGAVIGTGAVITKDVPPYAVCVGNPATVKKYRFSPEEIELLLEMRWWDLPFDDIQRLAVNLFSPDIESLKRRVDQYRSFNQRK